MAEKKSKAKSKPTAKTKAKALGKKAELKPTVAELAEARQLEEDEFSTEVYLDESNLEGKSLLQLRRILSFYDREKDEEAYYAVKAKINEVADQEPHIQFAHHGERIWSYFYEKYVVRILLFLVLFMMGGKPEKAVLQPSFREFPDKWLSVLFAAGFVLIIWKVYQAYKQAKGVGRTTWVKTRLHHVTVTADGETAGFLRLLFINVLKSWSFILWAVFISILAENYLAPEVFAGIKPLVGSFYGKQPGLLWLIGIVLFIFWVVDMIALEKTGRSMHDRLSKTFVLKAFDGTTSEEMRDYLVSQNFRKN